MSSNLKEKTLLVISLYYPYKNLSYVSFVKEQVDALKENFKKVVVIAPLQYFPQQFSKFPFVPKLYSDLSNMKDYKYDNVEVYFPRYFTLPIESLRRKNGDFAYETTLKCIKSNNLKFDLIHSHFIWLSGYVGTRLKSKFNKRLIVTGHGFDVYDLPFSHSFWRKKTKSILNNVDDIITVSHSNKKYLKELGFNSKVIPNGFDDTKFRFEDKEQAKKKLKLDLSKKVIVSIGNLKSIKNHSSLIKACRELKKTKTDFNCYIIGGGELEESLKKQISEMKLDKFVKVLGAKPHKEIPLWMNAADVFAFPSHKESFGVVLIEALACGTPVVSTMNGGAEEIIISEEHGYLYKNSKDYNELSKLLNKSLNKQWDHNKIVEYSKQYQWDTIKQQILEVYKNDYKKN